ncbi:MAG: S8 family serine peptidase [Elusimicrobia bacterium]|nr:S8 family serine peptidase [Elusimicrobiota bacterium]
MSRTGPAAKYVLAALLLLPAAGASALKIERLPQYSPSTGQATYTEAAAGSAIVRFKAGVTTRAAADALSAAGFSLVREFGRFNWSSVALPDGMRVSAALALLRAMPQVEYAEPNRVYRARRTSDDPFLARQYALAQVQVFGAWEYETGSSSRATVALLDTGIDGSHPELSGKLAGTSRKFDPVTGAASDNQPPTPACNHATRASGVAAAASDNGQGVAGMSWGAGLLSLKVFADSDCGPDCSDAAGYGSCSTSEIAIASAINDAISLHGTPAIGKLIINMSLGSAGSCSAPLQSAVDSAVSAGVFLVAAAGNASAPFIDSPANCSGVYAVGATDMRDQLATFSNTDSTMTYKGLTAPGVDVYTTDIGGGYASATGTSFSSPLVAGLAALLWSAKPFSSAQDIFDFMKNSADDLGPSGPDRDFGWGRVNALKAMRLAMTGSKDFAGTGKAVAYPNPFRPKTARLVTFSIPDRILAPGAEVSVYTSEGELVKKLDGLAWDGKNAAGADVASGVYIFRVKTDKDAAVGKMALLR